MSSVTLGLSPGGWIFNSLIAGSNPPVNIIVAYTHDLVFGVHQSLDLPEATSPIPRKNLCSALGFSRVFTTGILQEVITRGGDRAQSRWLRVTGF